MRENKAMTLARAHTLTALFRVYFAGFKKKAERNFGR